MDWIPTSQISQSTFKTMYNKVSNVTELYDGKIDVSSHIHRTHHNILVG